MRFPMFCVDQRLRPASNSSEIASINFWFRSASVAKAQPVFASPCGSKLSARATTSSASLSMSPVSRYASFAKAHAQLERPCGSKSSNCRMASAATAVSSFPCMILAVAKPQTALESPCPSNSPALRTICSARASIVGPVPIPNFDKAQHVLVTSLASMSAVWSVTMETTLSINALNVVRSLGCLCASPRSLLFATRCNAVTALITSNCAKCKSAVSKMSQALHFAAKSLFNRMLTLSLVLILDAAAEAQLTPPGPSTPPGPHGEYTAWPTAKDAHGSPSMLPTNSVPEPGPHCHFVDFLKNNKSHAPCSSPYVFWPSSKNPSMRIL
mmetsp:Transcript_5109/g.19133  ORF Transcript_5109/g.19133 Transcript_5109/m.19133 type:complete len:327 (-) Transcript_5109:129-1109(-)